MAAATGLLAAFLPAGAAAQSPPRQTYSDQFTTRQPGASAGRAFAVDFVNPQDPEAKPPAISHVLLRLAPGSLFNTAALPQCRASDGELILLGETACPAGSKVGTNEVVVDTGFPGPARFSTSDFVFFNNQDELILLGRVRGIGARVVVRARIRANTFEVDIPPLPGTPPDGGADKRERATFFERSTVVDGRQLNYLTTPPTCPASGQWVNRVTYTYRDGVTQTAESASPCDRPSSGRPAPDRVRPLIRLSGVPPRGCAARDFTARVHVVDRSPLRRAVLQLDGRRVRESASKAFSARIPTGRLRAGHHRLTVTAVDVAGNRAVKAVGFRRCAVAPAFTG